MVAIGAMVLLALVYVIVVLPWVIGGDEEPAAAPVLEPHGDGGEGGVSDKPNNEDLKPVPNIVRTTREGNVNSPTAKRRIFTPAPEGLPSVNGEKRLHPQREDGAAAGVKVGMGGGNGGMEGSSPVATREDRRGNGGDVALLCDASSGFHDDEVVVAGDFSVKEAPGGSEAEALAQRRQLLRGFTPSTLPYELRWRPSRRIPLPTALVSCMVPRPLSLPSSPTSDNLEGVRSSLLERAVDACLGGVGVSPLLRLPLRERWRQASIRCLLRFYSNDFSSSAQVRGLPPPTSKCNGIYGVGLLDRFDKSEPWVRCGDAGPIEHGGSILGHTDSGASFVVCKSIMAHPSHTDPTSVCTANNVVVDFSKMLNGDYPWLAFQRGALHAPNCIVRNPVPPSHRPAEGMFIHCLADWMNLGYEDAHGGEEFCSNAPSSELKQRTFFLTRSGDFSPFAVIHDSINALIAYGLEDVRAADMQVVIMDRMGMGFYSPLLQFLLSPNIPLKWLPDMRNEKTCIRGGGAMFNIPARLSPVYNHDDCGAAPLYWMLSDLIQLVAGYYDTSQHPQLLGAPAPEALIVTVITRKNYATGHSIGRRIRNHKDLLRALQGMSLTNGPPPQGGVVVRNIDYALWDFDQQVAISSSTDVLIAMHGAGLVQSLFLPRRHGAVFEIFCPEKPSSNYRYQQLSAKLGLMYDSVEIMDESNTLNVGDAVQRVQSLATASWKKKSARTK